MTVSEDIKYVGVTDGRIDLFEGQYRVPNGMTYNSYVIMDEKTAVMDTVDAGFTDEWLNNLENALGGRKPDYLVVQHMEPDHSANIAVFAERYPEAKIAASAKAFVMMKQFFGSDYADRQVVLADGSKLELGAHTLNFVTAPMVHWPEVIMTYDSKDKVLFSADGFGRFGAADDSEWADEARRYYIGIVGKYGAQVQAVLKKAAALDIAAICPLHGPVLKDNLAYYIGLYDTWSSYRPEENGVLIAYSSVYGNTAKAALLLRDKLAAKGVTTVAADLARSDMSAVTADAFRYSKLVLATPTYNADVFPHMKEFINHLTERNFRARTVGMIENGSWAPMAAKVMKSMLEKCPDITCAEPVVSIKSAVNEQNIAQIEALAEELAK